MGWATFSKTTTTDMSGTKGYTLHRVPGACEVLTNKDAMFQVVLQIVSFGSYVGISASEYIESCNSSNPAKIERSMPLDVGAPMANPLRLGPGKHKDSHSGLG